MSTGRPWRRLLVVFLVTLAVLLVLRAFVGNVYRVSTPSMRPTLDAGDGKSVYVAVVYGAPDPLTRFDLTVFRQPGKPVRAVKRVVALPGESVQINNGDLWIDGELLDDDVHRTEFEVFDSSSDGFGDRFYLVGEGCPGGAPGPWSATEGGFRLEALDADPDDADTRMTLRPQVTTSGLAVDGTGDQWLPVGDLSATVSAHLGEVRPGARVELELRDGPDRFRAVLAEQGPGFVQRIERSRSGEPFETLFESPPIELAVPGSHRLFFRNRDGLLEFAVDRRARAVVGVEPGSPSGATGGQLGSRFAFGGSGVDLEVRSIRLARDFHWSSADGFGDFATGRSLQLGPDEVFLLGDNTLDSTDGRFFGPTPLGDLTARPVAVVWPPSEWRWLW